jgi:hypothetical protein
MASKNMPAHRIGRHWKFKRDEVDTWMKEGGGAALGRRWDKSQGNG